MIRTLFMILSSVPFVFIAGCLGDDLAGTEVGNPENVALSFVGIESDMAARTTTLFVPSGTQTLTVAKVVLAELQFRLRQGGGNSQVHFQGPYVVDCIHDQTIPDVEVARISKGKYGRLDVVLAKLENQSLPPGIELDDPIVGKSFYVEGTRSDGTPFVVTFDEAEDLSLESTLGFEMHPSGATRLFLAFNLSDWFANIDLDGATVSSGMIRIDRQNNASILDQLRLSIRLSTRLFRDQDDNGQLDASERTSQNILAQGF